MGESLDGKVALVTGAGRRLGRATALALAHAGADVIIHYRKSKDDAEETRLLVEEHGKNAWTVQADLEDPDAYDALVARAREAAGRLDVLVNNASIFPPGALEETTFEDVRLNVLVNAWAPIALSRAFARQVGRDGGRIVNFLDTRVAGQDRGHVAYTLSKRMLEAATGHMALEFAPRVTVNAVAPGPILPPEGAGPEHLKRVATQVPLQRSGTERDVTDAVLFLVQSAYVTGQVIYVDGGQHLGAWMTG